MHRRRQKRGTLTLGVACVVSAGIHVAFSPVFFGAIDAFLHDVAESPVRIATVSTDQWAKNRSVRSPDPNHAPASSAREAPKNLSPLDDAERKSSTSEPEKKEPEIHPSGQVVEVPPTADERPNPDARLLSKYNTHVERQTVARARTHEVGRVSERLVTKKAEPKQRENKVESDAIVGTIDSNEKMEPRQPALDPEPVGSPRRQLPSLLARDELKLKLDPRLLEPIANRSASEALRGNKNGLSFGAGASQAGHAGRAESLRELPSVALVVPGASDATGLSGSPSMDHVDGVPEGDGTFLNTREFKYATFFYRVRDSLYGHWVEATTREYRRRDPTGNIYGFEDRHTVLRVELNRDGALAGIQIEKASGADFLDTVAIEAFERAQPFVNPPTGLMDADGRIRFRFGFVVTTRGDIGMGLFRPL